MSLTWDEIISNLHSIKEIFEKSYKCLNVSRKRSDNTQQKHLQILVNQHNLIAQQIQEIYLDLNESNQAEIKRFSRNVKTRLAFLFTKLQVQISVPDNIFQIIETRFKSPTGETSDNASDSDTELTEESNSNDKPDTQPNTLPIAKGSLHQDNSESSTMTPADFINLATKILPDFNGEVENLQKFINALDLLNSIKETHELLAVQLIKTKLTQKAQKLITTENSIDEIKATLKSRVKGESSISASTKLLGTKQNGRSGNDFIKEIEELTIKLENAYISDGMNAELAQTFSTQTAVKAITKNARSEKVKTVMIAGQFKNISEVTTKFVQANTDIEEQRINFIQNRNTHGHLPRRGRGRRNFGYRGQNYSSQRNQNYPNYPQNRNGNRSFRQNYNANRNANNMSSSNRGRGQNVRYMEATTENDVAPQTAHLGNTPNYQN